MFRSKSLLAILMAGTVAACGPSADPANTGDNGEALAEMTPAAAPTPVMDSTAKRPAETAPAAKTGTAVQPTQPAPTQPPPAPPSVLAGTMATLIGTDTLTSRHNKVGDSVTAVLNESLRNASGSVVIPAGTVFHGTITDIAPAESPGGMGRMAFEFTGMELDGRRHAIMTTVDSLAFHMKGRGVTVGDAAKVAAGTAVGAVAGRIIGGNRTGTIVGAVAGTAAGVGIAAATRDIDILFDAGAPVWITFTAPFNKP